MTKEQAYEKWIESEPKSTTSYSAFNAGWEAAKEELIKILTKEFYNE
jgi:hypothetical protein